MERYPFALLVIANDVVHFTRDFTADSLVIKISERSWFNPYSCRRVADGVLAVLRLETTLPEGRVIEPFKLNPFAIEADGVIQVSRNGGIAAISRESVVWALLHAFLGLGIT